jgi:uncharacterized membrane protein YphA (DoxX/SURF4 family)
MLTEKILLTLFGPIGNGEALLAGRILFGGILAFMGLNHFMNLEEMTGYAEFKGLPVPKLSVIGSGLVLVLGGLGIVIGAYVALSSLVLAAFLFVSSLTMHDFWAANEDEKQNEMTHFLKNMVMVGASLGFFILSALTWPYALNIGLL